MSIAKSIIDIVSDQLRESGETKVTEVELEIGKLAGIEYESLDFALGAMKHGTIIESSRIVVRKPDGEALCNDCGATFKTPKDTAGFPTRRLKQITSKQWKWLCKEQEPFSLALDKKQKERQSKKPE